MYYIYAFHGPSSSSVASTATGLSSLLPIATQWMAVPRFGTRRDEMQTVALVCRTILLFVVVVAREEDSRIIRNLFLSLWSHHQKTAPNRFDLVNKIVAPSTGSSGNRITMNMINGQDGAATGPAEKLLLLLLIDVVPRTLNNLLVLNGQGAVPVINGCTWRVSCSWRAFCNSAEEETGLVVVVEFIHRGCCCWSVPFLQLLRLLIFFSCLKWNICI